MSILIILILFVFLFESIGNSSVVLTIGRGTVAPGAKQLRRNIFMTNEHRNVRRILVRRVNAPLPPEAKKILKI